MSEALLIKFKHLEPVVGPNKLMTQLSYLGELQEIV